MPAIKCHQGMQVPWLISLNANIATGVLRLLEQRLRHSSDWQGICRSKQNQRLDFARVGLEEAKPLGEICWLTGARSQPHCDANTRDVRSRTPDYAHVSIRLLVRIR